MKQKGRPRKEQRERASGAGQNHACDKAHHTGGSLDSERNERRIEGQMPSESELGAVVADGDCCAVLSAMRRPHNIT